VWGGEREEGQQMRVCMPPHLRGAQGCHKRAAGVGVWGGGEGRGEAGRYECSTSERGTGVPQKGGRSGSVGSLWRPK